MIDQNRRTPPAPSTAAASCRSRGIPCRPAVTRMNVKPRFAHTLDIATTNRAVSGSCSQPGVLHRREDVAEPTHVGERARPMVAGGTTTSGWRPRPTWRPWRRTSARNAPIPRRYLSASTARPTPKSTPSGTVIRAKRIGDPERVLELDAAEQVDVLVEAVRHAVVAEVVAPLLAEPHRPAERVDTKTPRMTADGSKHRHRQREVRPATSLIAGRLPLAPPYSARSGRRGWRGGNELGCSR